MSDTDYLSDEFVSAFRLMSRRLFENSPENWEEYAATAAEMLEGYRDDLLEDNLSDLVDMVLKKASIDIKETTAEEAAALVVEEQNAVRHSLAVKFGSLAAMRENWKFEGSNLSERLHSVFPVGCIIGEVYRAGVHSTNRRIIRPGNEKTQYVTSRRLSQLAGVVAFNREKGAWKVQDETIFDIAFNDGVRKIPKRLQDGIKRAWSARRYTN